MFNPLKRAQSSPLPEPSDKSYELRAMFGNRPVDIAEKLPKPAREKLKAIRDEAEGSRAWGSIPYEKMKATRGDIQQIELRLAEMNCRGVADNDKLVLAEKAGLEKFKAEARALTEEHTRRKETSRTIAGLAKRVEDYVEGLGSRQITLAPTTAAPELRKGETLADAIQKIRQRIENLQDEEQGARDAPITSQAAKQIARAHIEQLAARGRPNVLATVEGARPPEFQTRTIGAGQYGSVEVDTLALLAWVHRDALITALENAIDEDADDGSALSDEERADRIAGARREVLALERSEESLIEFARSTGLQIARRADADVRALLGLSDQMPGAK